jgi:tetratricopeptide (TPR) repeat protein
MSWYLSEFADCLIGAEKYEEANSALVEAEQIITETDERSHVGEIYRLRGLLSARGGDITRANSRFLQAIDWARSRNTKLFELRAVSDLTRLKFLQGQHEVAVKELQVVIAKFSPHLHFEISDLHQARELLQNYTSNRSTNSSLM